jgi:hypothetical protein
MTSGATLALMVLSQLLRVSKFFPGLFNNLNFDNWAYEGCQNIPSYLSGITVYRTYVTHLPSKLAVVELRLGPKAEVCSLQSSVSVPS